MLQIKTNQPWTRFMIYQSLTTTVVQIVPLSKSTLSPDQWRPPVHSWNIAINMQLTIMSQTINKLYIHVILWWTIKEILFSTSEVIHCFIATILFCMVKNDHTHQATTSFMTNKNNFSHSQVLRYYIFFLSFPLFCLKNTDQDSERKTI